MLIDYLVTMGEITSTGIKRTTCIVQAPTSAIAKEEMARRLSEWGNTRKVLKVEAIYP